jgi:hypothetical protein
MSDSISVIIRTADQTRKAQVDIEGNKSAGDLIQASVDNWKLPNDTEYTLVNVTQGKTVAPASLVSTFANSNDILEVQPVLVAGGA